MRDYKTKFPQLFYHFSFENTTLSLSKNVVISLYERHSKMGIYSNKLLSKNKNQTQNQNDKSKNNEVFLTLCNFFE